MAMAPRGDHLPFRSSLLGALAAFVRPCGGWITVSSTSLPFGSSTSDDLALSMPQIASSSQILQIFRQLGAQSDWICGAD
jgi:hypothetical protein